ncbi:2-hydroxychromene-2-carboxylate isomerase [Salinispora vitiensis]|uniref:2-hydroxychromene-2-carboxylate isomerase n=1 Tax=Salinispora vitiensis TaxID=999544 RepID=UPI000370D7CE|nr:DsbA family protein [Salinispora vitiensis]
MRQRPRLYFAFRSPYSWMALRRLEERLPEARDLIEYRPYWEPDRRTMDELTLTGAEFHYTPMSKAKHLYLLADIKRLAHRLGYSMAWPIDIDPQWDLPHLAWLYARRLGADREFYAAVTAARWERGENICDPDVLGRAATSAGLDATRTLAAADDPEVRTEGVRILNEAYHEDIFGIPYFKLGFQRFWGLDRLDHFIEALHAWSARTNQDPSGGSATPSRPEPRPTDTRLTGIPSAVLGAGGYDRDSAGGCG